MQKLWKVQSQGLVLVLHPGQVQLCNCNNLKVAESTNWSDEQDLPREHNPETNEAFWNYISLLQVSYSHQRLLMDP